MSIGPDKCAELHLIVYLDWLFIVAQPAQGQNLLSTATYAAIKNQYRSVSPSKNAIIRVHRHAVRRTCLYDAYAGEAEYLCAQDPDTCCLEQHCIDCRS